MRDNPANGASPIYKRVILKLSGESLSDKENFLSVKSAKLIAEEIKSIFGIGAQIGIVLGGGNKIRGCNLEKQGINRNVADKIGMMVTIENALFLQEILEQEGMVTRVQSAIEIKRFAEPYIERRAIRHLEKGRIVILAGGTGNTRCSTDNAAITRALELRADAVLKGTKVGGLYDKDPVFYKTAKLIPEISYKEMIKSGFSEILDNSALGVIIDNTKEKIPIHIFNIFTKGNLRRVICGEKIGSRIF